MLLLFEFNIITGSSNKIVCPYANTLLYFPINPSLANIRKDGGNLIPISYTENK